MRLAAGALLVALAVVAADCWPGGEPDGVYCYAVVDSNGVRHESVSAVYPASGGWYWARRDAWGVVPFPASVEVDKDCLRARGVPIPGDENE